MSDQVENPGGDESIEDAIDALLEEVDADCIEFEEKKARTDAQAEAEANGTAALGDDGMPIVSDESAADAAAQAEEAIERADEKLDELESAADELVASVSEQATEAEEAEAVADTGAEEHKVEEPAVGESGSEEPVVEDSIAEEPAAEEAETVVDQTQLDEAVDRMLGELGVEEPEGETAAAHEDDATGPEADSSSAVGGAPEVASPEAESSDAEASAAGAVETEAAAPDVPEPDASVGKESGSDAAPEPEGMGEAVDGESDDDDVLAAAVSFLADEGSAESETAEEPESVEEDALHHAAGELLDGAGSEDEDAEPGEVGSGQVGPDGVEPAESEVGAAGESDSATESAPAPAADAAPESAPKPRAPTAVTDPSAPPSFDALLDGAFEDSDGEIDEAVDTAAVAAEAAQHSPVVGPDEGGQKEKPSKKARAATPRAAVVTETLPAGAGRFARIVAWARPRAIELGRRGLQASGPLGARLVVLLSKPLDGKPPKIRDSIGWVALWTMFLAVCVWGYLVVRAPVKPVPDGNGSKVVATETVTRD